MRDVVMIWLNGHTVLLHLRQLMTPLIHQVSDDTQGELIWVTNSLRFFTRLRKATPCADEGAQDNEISLLSDESRVPEPSCYSDVFRTRPTRDLSTTVMLLEQEPQEKRHDLQENQPSIHCTGNAGISCQKQIHCPCNTTVLCTCS